METSIEAPALGFAPIITSFTLLFYLLQSKDGSEFLL
jgi:hypothetical protein